VTTERLTERVAAPFSEVRVDREKGVVYGVLLCGVESKNGRKYPWGKGLKHSKGMYERKVGYWGHDATADQLCWYENEWTDDKGRPRADMHVYKSHPKADRVFEAAERGAPEFGLSHVANCVTRTEGDWVIVESIEVVERVDVVEGPATVAGFHESKATAKGGRTVPKLREWVAGTIRHPKVTTRQAIALKALAEDDMLGGVDMPADAPAPDAPDGDADDAVMAAFKAAIAAVADELLANSGDPKRVKELTNKIKQLATSHGAMNADGTPDTDGDPTTGAGDEMAAEEGRRPKTYAGLIAEAKGHGLAKPDADDVAVLEGIATPAGRKAYCERIAATLREAEAPRSGGKRPGAGPAPDKKPALDPRPAAVPTDGKAFAESVR